MELIQVNNVTKTYITDDKEHHALSHFNYGFPKSGLFGIVGKSGSGKSTLLNMIALLDKPTSGEIYFNSENINKWKNNRKDLYRSVDIGIVFQHYNLIENEDTIYNIILPYLIRGGKETEARKKAVQLLESINFRKDLYQQKVCNLSGGEKERVAILRALINEPKLLLADEPTGALDSHNSVLVMEILKEISLTKLVIVVSHNTPLIKKYADKLLEIKDGNLISVNDNTLKTKRGRKKNEK